MNILAIETSCDETAISIIEIPHANKNTTTILSNVVVSQIELHRPYGGVFPMLAKREHSKNIVPVLETALRDADLLKLKKKTSPLPENILFKNKEKSCLLSIRNCNPAGNTSGLPWS